MNGDITNGRIAKSSPRFQGRIAGAYYLLTIMTGIVILFAGSSLHYLVDLLAAVFYVVVTVFFYALTKRGTDILSKER